MIDYRAHALALATVRELLASSSFGDPDADAARDQTLADIADAEGHAVLGALVDYLMMHAASDGTELALLGRAADLWDDGVALYGALGDIRGELEAALERPAETDAASRFNTAAVRAQELAQRLHGLQGRILSLRDEVDPLPHLPPHPRQADRSPDAWDWGNFMLARRTDAFVRSLAAHASDPATRAFAFGALTSYGANVSGSSYLGHVVGGPRRGHRFRDRLARNAVGSWLRRQHPSLRTLTDMADQIGFGVPDVTLPPEVQTLLEDAVSDTFEPSRTPPLPDLALGYQRLLGHLRLLDRFGMPPVPEMPSAHFTELLFADPAKPPPTLRPQSVGVTGDTGGGVGVGSNTPGSDEVGRDDAKKANGDLCAAVTTLIVLFVILVVVALINCIAEWADGNECSFFEELVDLVKGLFEEDPPHPTDPPSTQDPDVTAQGLAAFAATEQAVELVGYLWDLQQQMWEGLHHAYGYLAKTGLIYPDDIVETPAYKQFTSTPSVASNKWPHRPEADPDATYHLYPSSHLEEPVEAPSAFPGGASPDAFALTGHEQDPTAAAVVLPLWLQIARGERDSTNFDLDADRGYKHPCWQTGGSVEDNPLDVVVLSYEDQ